MEMVVGSKQAATSADWDNLQPELLRLIAGKLANICDYIRFRCVCPSWRSAASRADHTDLFLPWMIIYACRKDNTVISFLNVAGGSRHCFNLPEVRGKWIYGSSHGWLVMLDPPPDNQPHGCTSVSLLNSTRAHIPLPALPSSLKLSHNTNTLLCSHPVASSHRSHQLLLVVWNYNSNRLASLNHGDDNWTMFNKTPFVRFGDIAYFGKSLYSIGLDRRLAVLDIASSIVCRLVDPRPPDISTNYSSEWRCRHYLVESSGDLLLFVRFNKVANDQCLKAVHLFKLDVSRKEGWKWARVTNDNGDNSFTCYMKRFTAEYGRNRGKRSATIRPDLVAGIVANILTGKLHYCQVYSREIFLIPGLY